MRRNLCLSCLLALGVLFGSLPALAQDGFTSDFPLDECTFNGKGGNRFFLLQPGRQLYLTNARCVLAGDCEELEEVWITVLRAKRWITLTTEDGQEKRIRTRVVEEVETADGELTEISRNFFAECRNGGDVYYFGEDVDIYEDGEIVSHDGAWRAGEDGAKPGIIMPGGAFLLGSRYYQEVAPDVALDRAEHVAMGLDVAVPAGNFSDCVETQESSPLEPGDLSRKVYCPGIGMVIDEDLELAEVTLNGPE